MLRFFVQKLQLIEFACAPGFNKGIVGFGARITRLSARVYTISPNPIGIELDNHPPAGSVTTPNGIDRFTASICEHPLFSEPRDGRQMIEVGSIYISPFP